MAKQKKPKGRVKGPKRKDGIRGTGGKP